MRDQRWLDAPVRKRLDAFTREAARIYRGDAAALHHTRVASRRLRELLPLVELDNGTARKLGRRLEKVTRQLGVVRELDVLMDLMQELARDRRYPSTALKRATSVVAAERAVAFAHLESRLSLSKLERLARRIERAVKSLEPDHKKTARRSSTPAPRHAWQWALEARAARRASRVQDLIDTTGAVYSPGRLHDVRIALKKLRYAGELLAETQPGTAAGDLTVLKNAQDLLGRLHDLEVLIDRARQLQASLSPPDLIGGRQLASLVHRLEDDCRQLHARYVRDRAKLMAVADRMGGATTHALRVTRRAAG